MEIRPAKQEDYAAIAPMVSSPQELFLVYPKGKHPFSVGQLHQLSEIRQELTVAIECGKVVGFANLYDHKPGRWISIGNVIIHQAYRGKGVGRTLVRHMIQSAFDKYGVAEVRISVFSHNTPALLLYTSLHFEPYGIEERRDPTGARVALIHLKLTRPRGDTHFSISESGAKS